MPATPAELEFSADEIRSAIKANRKRLAGDAMPVMESHGLQMWNMDDLQFLPQPQWLIEQIVEEKGLTVFFGPDKVGKTMMLSSWLWAWAAGMDHWFNETFRMHDGTDGGRRVLYLLLEGQASFYDRYDAFRDYESIEDPLPNFRVVAQGLSLFDAHMRWDEPSTWPDSAQGVYQMVEEFRPHVLVIDTLSRSTAGMDENSSQMANFVAWLDMLRDTFDTATVVVTHTPLQEQNRPRGHSSLKGAVSSYVRIEGQPDDTIGKLVVGPHRNAESHNPNLGGNEYGYWVRKKSHRAAFVVEPYERQRVHASATKLAFFDAIDEDPSILDKRTQKELAAEYGVSPRNLRYWIADYRAEGNKEEPDDVGD